MTTLLVSALEWAAQGIPVFPVGKNKAPLTPNGHKDASTDTAIVTALFDAAPNAFGIGAAMGRASGLFAIDADTYKTDTGESARAFVALLSEKGLLPDTRVHTTMNGGTHYIYYSETSWPNCKPVAGVEVKGEGGYIVVPPTPGYSVVSEGLAEAPEGLLHLLGAAKAQAQMATIQQLKAQVLSGESFHDALTALAAKLAAAGADQAKIQVELLNTLEASVARSPSHPRHSRWKAVMEDKGGEFSRLAKSGYTKYNPDAAEETLKELASGLGFLEVWAPPPPINESIESEPQAPTPQQELEKLPVGEWPFQEGYFGFQDLDVLASNYVAFPLLTEEETTILSAEPKAGKTLFLQTLGMHIAAGADLGNIKITEARPVIYLALESRLAIRKRLIAWRREVDPTGELLNDETFPFFVLERPLNLLDPAVQAKFAAEIAAADLFFQKKGFAPMGAIVVDTLTKGMAGGDQNSVEDTSKFFEFIARVRELGCHAAILIAHHDGKTTGKTRGSSNIEAEPDTLLGLRRDAANEDEMVVEVRMARSIEDTFQFRFGKRGVVLGVSEQGFEITAPVLYPCEAPVVPQEDLEGQHIAETMKELEILTAICELGEGQRLVKPVHKMLIEKFKGDYEVFDARVDSARLTKYFERLIPATGRVVANKYLINVFSQKHRNDPDRILVSHFYIRRLINAEIKEDPEEAEIRRATGL